MSWGLALKNLLWPQFCKECGIRLITEEIPFFCPTCWEQSPRIERPFCSVCGLPHPAGVGLFTPAPSQVFPCGPCATRRHPPPWRRIVGAAIYTGAIEKAIKLFKFHERPILADALGALLIETVERELQPERYDLIIPVPLHRVRLRERGYNQSLLLAEKIMPVFPRARLEQSLQRIRATKVQSTLSHPAERQANVRDAFAVQDTLCPRDARVLLIDDVVTTGGTVSECARTLRKAGVQEIDVLAVCLVVSHTRRPEHPTIASSALK